MERLPNRYSRRFINTDCLIVRALLLITFFLTGLPSLQAAQTAELYKTAYRYNGMGQLTGTIKVVDDGDGGRSYLVERNTYDANGNLTQVETGYLTAWQDETIAPSNWPLSASQISSSRLIEYDDWGRKIGEAQADPSGNKQTFTQYSYDDLDRLECKAVRNNPNSFSTSLNACSPGPASDSGQDRVTAYTYNDFDQVLTERRAVGTDLEQTYVRYTYTSWGGMENIYDANGNRTKLEYDDSYRLHKRIYPSKTVTGDLNTSDYNQYVYDENGNLISEKKRNDADFTYTFDANNRMLTKDGPGSSMDTRYSYDLRGLTLTSLFQSSGDGITNTFNGFGELSSATTDMLGSSRTLTYQYDAHSNRTQVTHPDGIAFEYAFDALDRAYWIRESGSTLLWVNYNQSGQLAGFDRNLGRSGASTRLAYDAIGRLARFDQNFSAAVDDLTHTFTYIPASQIGSVSSSNTQYRYFGNDNREGGYEVNGLNQYVSVNGTQIDYDDNGNMTEDGSTVYQYDDENRLVSVSGNKTATISYDPLGRLFQTQINGTTRQFLYDGDALIAEYSTSDATAPLHRYVHGDQIDQPLVQYDGSAVGASVRRFLHSDHLGSVIAHSDYAGDVQVVNSYDVYGVPSLENEGRFGYTGQIWLDELDLYYYKARLYDPGLGRFLQTDPIFYEDQMNMYAYVGNDPVNMVDPTGKFLVPGALIGAALDITAQVAVIALTEATVSDFSIASVGVSAVAGAVGAGFATAATKVGGALKAGRAAQAGINLAADVGASAAGSAISGGEITAGGIAADIVAGKAGGKVIGEAAAALPKSTKNMSQAVKTKGMPGGRAASKKALKQAKRADAKIDAARENIGAGVGSGAGGKLAGAVCDQKDSC